MRTNHRYRVGVMLAVITFVFTQCFGQHCPADLNGDRVIDNGDIMQFVESFLARDPVADMTGDGIIDNGDIIAFVEEYQRGCQNMPDRQDYRGALELPAGSRIEATTTSSGAPTSTDYVIESGDFAGSPTQAWLGMRLRFNAIDARDIIFRLDDATADANVGAITVRIDNNGDHLYAYIFNDTNGAFRGPKVIDSIQTGVDYFFFVAWDASQLSTDLTTAGNYAVGWSWQDGDASLTLEQNYSTSFAGIGCSYTVADAASDFFYTVQGGTASGIEVAEIAVGDDLTGLSDDDVLAWAKGEKNPASFPGALHVWALDRYSTETPAGNEVERVCLVDGTTTLGTMTGAVTWTTDRLGNDLDTGSDVAALDFDSIVYDPAGALQGFSLSNSTWAHLSDSFGAYWIGARFVPAMIQHGLSTSKFDLAGLAQGYRENNGPPVTFTRNTPTGTGALVRDVAYASNSADAGGYDNTMMQDEVSLTERYGFPHDYVFEIYGGTGGASFAGDSGISNDLSIGDFNGETWFSVSDYMRARLATYIGDSGGQSPDIFSLRLNGTAQSILTNLGVAASAKLTRWSNGDTPGVTAPDTIASGDRLYWADDLDAPVAVNAVPFLGDILCGGVDANTYTHITGIAVARTDSNGDQVDGINYVATSISSQSTINLADNQDESSNDKGFSDDNLLAWIDGAQWKDPSNDSILFVFDIADLETSEANFDSKMIGADSAGQAPPTSPGFVTRCRWIASQMGFSDYTIGLVNSFAHNRSTDDDIETLRQRFIDNETWMRSLADEHSDIFVLSTFRVLGGAFGWDTEALLHVDTSSPNRYDTVAWPHREGRWLDEVRLPALGITPTGNRLLDSSGLHTDTPAEDDWEAIAGYAYDRMVEATAVPASTGLDGFAHGRQPGMSNGFGGSFPGVD